MGHKTLIGGTAYEINGGKAKVNGTGYSISKGETLIGGTGYDIRFFSPHIITEYRYVPERAISSDFVFTQESDGRKVVMTSTFSTSNRDSRAIGGFSISGISAGDSVQITFSCDTGYLESNLVIFDGTAQTYNTSGSANHYTYSKSDWESDYAVIAVSNGNEGTMTRTLTVHSVKINGEEIL